MFCKKGGLRKRPAILFKKRFWRSCFSVNFAKFKNTFFIELVWWLLLTINFSIRFPTKSLFRSNCQRCSTKWRNPYDSRSGVFYKKDVLKIGIIRRETSDICTSPYISLLKRDSETRLFHVNFAKISKHFFHRTLLSDCELIKGGLSLGWPNKV